MARAYPENVHLAFHVVSVRPIDGSYGTWEAMRRVYEENASPTAPVYLYEEIAPIGTRPGL